MREHWSISGFCMNNAFIGDDIETHKKLSWTDTAVLSGFSSVLLIGMRPGFALKHPAPYLIKNMEGCSLFEHFYHSLLFNPFYYLMKKKNIALQTRIIF